jgi:hypothetical protein
MGRNQNANWCVTHPLFDHVLGTRREFLGVQPSAPGEDLPPGVDSVTKGPAGAA